MKQFSLEEAVQEGLFNANQLPHIEQNAVHVNDDDEVENDEEDKQQAPLKKMSKPKNSEYSVVR